MPQPNVTTPTASTKPPSKLRRVVITDPYVLQLIVRAQREIGDSSASRTAGRIIQLFHGMGLSLDPESEQSPGGQQRSSTN